MIPIKARRVATVDADTNYDIRDIPENLMIARQEKQWSTAAPGCVQARAPSGSARGPVHGSRSCRAPRAVLRKSSAGPSRSAPTNPLTMTTEPMK